MYDYAAFGWLLFLFIIIMTLVILLSRKKPKLAIFLVFISFLLLFVAPFGVKYFIDQSVRKVEVITDKVTKLNFASSLIVTGHIQNEGKMTYNKCKITANVTKYDKLEYKNTLNSLKPIISKSIDINESIEQNQEATFKIVIEDFKYKGDYNVTLSGVCY
jgi:energy-coupling factor transporter transmembrane protein EcfT